MYIGMYQFLMSYAGLFKVIPNDFLNFTGICCNLCPVISGFVHLSFLSFILLGYTGQQPANPPFFPLLRSNLLLLLNLLFFWAPFP